MAKETSFVKIKVDGTEETVKTMTLKEVQDFCGGYVTIVNTRIDRKKFVVICDEEGLLKGYQPNKRFPLLVGNVILTNNKEWC